MPLSDLARLSSEALYLALWVSAPALLVALIIGLATSILSTATQIQEQSLSFVPKLIGVSVALAVFGGWMATQVVAFTDQLWRAIPALTS